MFHVEQFLNQSQNIPRGTIGSLWQWIKMKCSTWNNSSTNHKIFHVEHLPSWYRELFVIQLFSFLLTFSKAGWLSFGVAVLYFAFGVFHVEQFLTQSPNVPRGTIGSFWQWIKMKCSTWNNSSPNHQMFHVEQWKKPFRCILVIIGLIFLTRAFNWYFFLWQPLEERLFLQRGYIAEISQNTLLGTGIGQSVLVMQDFSSEKLLSWQFQPAHNMYLILWAEIGLIGIMIFFTTGVYFLKMFHVEQFLTQSPNVPRGTKEFYWLIRILKGSMLYLLLISLFDHYLWDIESTRLLFWYIFGLLMSATISFKELTKY